MCFWSFIMKLNNPVKFVNNNIDGTLIARGEILCQYSAKDTPGADDWVNEFDINLIYKWIRISFDCGKSFPFQYKLNNTDISIEFEISENEFVESGNADYQYMYTYEISNKAIFDEIKYKPIGIFVKDENKSTSVLSPIVYRTENEKYYLDILVTDLFIQHNKGKICFIKN